MFYDKTPEGKWGTKQHWDNCMMTMLMQDDVGGLELRYKGNWYPVVPQYGKFVINFGKENWLIKYPRVLILRPKFFINLRKMMEHFTYGVITGSRFFIFITL